MYRSFTTLALALSILFSAGPSSEKGVQSHVSDSKSENGNNTVQSVYTTTNKQMAQSEEQQGKKSFRDFVTSKNNVKKPALSKRVLKATSEDLTNQKQKVSSEKFISTIESLNDKEKPRKTSTNSNQDISSRYTAEGKDAVRIEKKTVSSFKNSINIYIVSKLFKIGIN